jgi:septum formation protein
MKQIILASTSPRRKELLSLTKLDFTIVPSDYEEDNTLPLPPGELVKELALGKAASVAKHHPDAVVIGADTLVAAGNKIIGKPRNKQDLIAIFHHLSGTSHSAFSGIAIIEGDKVRTESVETKVFFRELTDREINQYAETDEWNDKAGGYAIQATGSLFIDRIEGNYTNIVGLPLSTLMRMLEEFDVEIAL